MARRPVGGSWRKTTSSNSPPSCSKTDTSGSIPAPRRTIRRPHGGTRLCIPARGVPMMRAMVPSAYMRVFQSLEALPDPERERWERYIVAGEGPQPRPKRYRQVPAGPRTPYPFLECIDGDHADVRREDGKLYVCPRSSHVEALASLVAPREPGG